MSHKTPHSLHHFCKEGNYKRVEEILQAEGRAVIEKKRYGSGDSPLLVAANAGNSRIVELLIRHGADVNACDNRGETALHLVAAKNHTDCATVLLNAPNRKVQLRSKVQRLTPYEVAKQYKSTSVKRLLKSAEIKDLARKVEDEKCFSELLKELEGLSSNDVTPDCYGEMLLSAIRMQNEEAAIAILCFSAKGSPGPEYCLDLKGYLALALEKNLHRLAVIMLICVLVKLELLDKLPYLLYNCETGDQNSKLLEDFFKNAGITMDSDVIATIRNNMLTIKCYDLAAPVLYAIHSSNQADAAKHLLWHNCTRQSDIVQWKNMALPTLEPSWLLELHQLPAEKPFYSRISKLDLRKNRLQRVPALVFQLPLINVIYLDSNELEELPEHSNWSRSLRSLYLSNNHLCSLPETMATAHLTTLKLSHNKFTSISLCICEMVWLETLDITGNRRITSFPEEMGRLTNLKHFAFDADKIVSPFGWQKHAKSAQDLVRWLQVLLRSSKRFAQVKLMVTGWQAKGKTTLVHRLNDDFKYNENVATTGIQISGLKESSSWWPLLSASDHRLSFQVWDFAGHEDFYVTHMCFLSAFALYLLVWNLTDGEDGIKDLSSWLNNISARTGHAKRKSMVIIVGTHLDVVTEYKDDYGTSYVEDMRNCIKKLLQERNDEHLTVVDIVEVSCSSVRPKGITHLKNKVYNAVKMMMKRCGDGEKEVRLVDELVPHAFTVLAKRIQEMRSERRESNLPPILTRQQLRAEFSHVIRSDPSDNGRPNDPNDFRQATQFLEERGFILHFNDSSGLLRDLYFIDPRWLCDLMSHIITVPFTMKCKKPILNKGDLHALMQRDGFPPSYTQQYIQLLNRFQVAYSLTDEEMLIPSQLPDDKPVAVLNVENHRSFTPIQRVYSISQIPHGLFSRIIVILLCNMKEILQLSSSDVSSKAVVDLLGNSLFCWRSGIYFRDTSLLFMVTSLPGPDASSANLHIQVSPDGTGQKALSFIVDHIEGLLNEWFMGINKASVVRKVPCHVCEQSGDDSHAFDLEKFEHDDERGEHFKCNKKNISLPLQHVAPDLAFRDVDEEFLLQETHLTLNQHENMELGKGDFGVVYRGECRGNPAAIKVFKGENPYREVRKELAVLRRVVSHPNLVSILGVSRRPLCIAMELARGSLDSALFAEPLISIPRIVIVSIGREIADALCFLHNLGIVHRDLKPANILLYSLQEADEVHVKLSDFGTTAFVNPGGLKSTFGPTVICAPEMLEFASLGGGYGPEVDVYSFAIFLYNLVTRRKAFHMIQDSARIQKTVLKKGRPSWTDVPEARHLLPNLVQLMCACWCHAPFDRPTAVQARDQLVHPFFQLLMGKFHFKEQRAPLHVSFVSGRCEFWFVYCTPVRCVASIFSTSEMKFKGHVTLSSDSSVHVLFTCSIDELLIVLLQTSAGEVLLRLCHVENNEVTDMAGSPLPFNSLNDVAVYGSSLHLATAEGFYVILLTKAPVAKYKVKKVSAEESLAVVVTSEEIWLATRDSILVFSTRSASSLEVTTTWKVREGKNISEADSEPFELPSHTSSSTRETWESTRFISAKLDVSKDGQHVWLLHRGSLVKYDAASKNELLNLKCANLMRSIGYHSMEDSFICFSIAHDTVWLGTRNGVVLILGANAGNPLAWARPYETEVTGLIFCASTQPARMISVGNNLNRKGLGIGDQATCALVVERSEVVDCDRQRKISDGRTSPKREFRRCMSDSSWTEATGGTGEVALIWESLSCDSLKRIVR